MRTGKTMIAVIRLPDWLSSCLTVFFSYVIIYGFDDITAFSTNVNDLFKQHLFGYSII